jgi:hypothetical protein
VGGGGSGRHAARMRQVSNTYKILVGKPEGKRHLERLNLSTGGVR